MVSARPQFEAACQLQKSCWSSTVGVQRACTSPTSVRFTRPAPDVMAGLAEWFRRWIVDPVYESSILSSRPKMGGAYNGDYSRPATVKCEFNSRTVHQFWLGNSTAECWSEKPVDTVQFRAEPPDFRGVAVPTLIRRLGPPVHLSAVWDGETARPLHASLARPRRLTAKGAFFIMHECLPCLSGRSFVLYQAKWLNVLGSPLSQRDLASGVERGSHVRLCKSRYHRRFCKCSRCELSLRPYSSQTATF